MDKSKYYCLIDAEEKSLKFNLAEIWKYKDLILLLVRREFVSKYKQTILGPAWAVIQPLLTTVVFTFVFGNVAGLANCGTVPTFLFYMSGNIAWQFFSGCLTGTASTFIANRGIMGKVYFPRLCMPISTVLGQMISFFIQAVMFIVFWAIYMFIPGYVISPSKTIIMIPILLLHMSLLSLGCGIIISAVTTKYRDLQFLVSFGVSLWMYGTPVAYSLDIFEGSLLYYVCKYNPMSSVIELFRYSFLGASASNFDWIAYGISWICTIVIIAIGVLLFNKVEKTFMDTV